FAPQPLNAQAEFWRNTRPSIALAEHSRRAAMRRARAAPIKAVLPLSCAQLVNLDPASRRLDADLEMLRLHDFGDADRTIGDDVASAANVAIVADQDGGIVAIGPPHSFHRSRHGFAAQMMADFGGCSYDRRRRIPGAEVR